MTVKFTIPGKPQGKARPRVTVHGTYTPKPTKDYENLVRAEYLRQTNGAKFPAGAALGMYIMAYYPIPKGTSRAKRRAMEECVIYPIARPDIDNIFKAVADALNGVAYHDDAQIVNCEVNKIYAKEPCVRVLILRFPDYRTTKENDNA
jgi:Holliday junction resolvase RusA-like endonuclease